MKFVWLEVGRRVKGEGSTSLRMLKSESVGMKAETTGGNAVEGIAHDGGTKTEGMGAMDTQLMGSSRLRPKMDKTIFTSFPMGYGALAVFATHHLTRTIVGIGADGEVDGAAFGFRTLLEECNVAFLHFVFYELTLKIVVGFLCKGYNHKAGSVHIEAMDDDGPRGGWETLLDNVENAWRFAIVAGNSKHAAGFVDDGKGRLGMKNMQLAGHGLVLLEHRVWIDLKAAKHVGEDGFATAATSGIEVAVGTKFVVGRATYPKLGHRYRVHSEPIGGLKEFGSAALAASRGWSGGAAVKGGVVVAENVDEVGFCAFGIEHAVLTEEPLLQGLGALLAFGFKLGDGG